MEIIYGSGLAFLEMMFLFAVLLLLHALRRVIGSACFYVVLGILFVFTQLVSSAGLQIFTGYPGLNFNLSQTVLLLPFLSALLVIYITDGTLEAQRLIIALMAGLGIYSYLCSLTVAQINWELVSSSGKTSAEYLAFLVRGSTRNMAASVIAFAVDLFLLPILYQKLRNFGCRLFFCAAGALFLVQAVDSLICSAICYWGQTKLWEELSSSYLSRALFTVWMAVIASLYLSRCEREQPGYGRRSLDIIIAFFGTYGRAKALEHILHETEERYRLLFRSAADMIAIIDRNGIISDTNAAAVRMLGLDPLHDKGVSLPDLSDVSVDLWKNLPEFANREEGGDDVRCTAKLLRTEVEAELSFSPVTIGNTPMLVVFGRDVTEIRRLERDREAWREQTFHQQRLESIGRLAGGIAHDFNNYLHAIQGHLDIIRYMHPVEDADVNRHLDQVDSISVKASQLTRQLLGFARKGNYTESTIELNSFLRATVSMFVPGSASGMIPVSLDLPEETLRISGDQIQLQQAILNIFFNARDAMAEIHEKQRRIFVSLKRVNVPDGHFTPPAEAVIRSGCQYLCISIRDTGPGIPDSVRNRIFEPFFTTKPVGQGTGMGLPMAYGILLTHKGWLQVENLTPPDEYGTGAVFSLILPEYAETNQDVSMSDTAIIDISHLTGK